MACHCTFLGYQILNTGSLEIGFSLKKIFGCLYCRYKTVLQNRGIFFSVLNQLKQVTEY